MTTQHDERAELIRELVRLADIHRDCGRLVSKDGTAERVMRKAAALLAADSRAGGEELPPLPEAKAIVRGPVSAFRDPEYGSLVDFDCEGPLAHNPEDGEALFTADQMEDYARAALLAADSRAGGELVAWRCSAPPCKCDQSNYSRCAFANFNHPQPQAVARGWKDRDTAKLVNDLRDVAVQFHAAEQLRERIAHIIRPLADLLSASPAAPEAPAEREPLTQSDALQVVTAERDFWNQVANKHRATIAGLESSVFHLSRMFDEQIQMLVEVEEQLCLDGHYGPFEDGEHALCDRIRAHIAAHHIGKPERTCGACGKAGCVAGECSNVGINGLTESETAASASVMGLTSKSKEQEK